MDEKARENEWKRVGSTVRELRELRGVTVDELANKLLISRSYMSNIEGGRKRLKPEYCAKIAEFLKVRQISILRPDEFPADDAA